PIITLAILVRHRPGAQGVLADLQPTAAGDIYRIGLVSLEAPRSTVIAREIAAQEPVRRVDQAPAAPLPGVEPPVARVIEQLKDVAGPIDDAGVGDHQDLLPIALVAREECLDVVVVEGPQARGDDAVRPIGGEL